MSEINLKIQTLGKKTVWTLQGDWTVFALSQGKKAAFWLSKFPVQGDWEIVGKELTHLDTAGLAFLLECVLFVRAKKMNLKFSLLPKRVVPLIKAQGLWELMKGYVEAE